MQPLPLYRRMLNPAGKDAEGNQVVEAASSSGGSGSPPYSCARLRMALKHPCPKASARRVGSIESGTVRWGVVTA
jgi:hypothetical protein